MKIVNREKRVPELGGIKLMNVESAFTLRKALCSKYTWKQEMRRAEKEMLYSYEREV